MWDGQIAAFKDRYRILVYDTRGHGAARRRRERTRWSCWRRICSNY